MAKHPINAGNQPSDSATYADCDVLHWIYYFGFGSAAQESPPVAASKGYSPGDRDEPDVSARPTVEASSPIPTHQVAQTARLLLHEELNHHG